MNYIDLLKENKQEHILKFLDKMNDKDKEKLIKQIEQINFDQLKKLYKTSKKNKNKAIIIEHIPFVDKYKLDENRYNKLKNIGEEVIKSGKYAVATMAGGQGTRLDHNGPKGTFLVNIKPQPKYLFEIIAENLQKVNKKYNVILPWYIMTSTENNEKTVEFFEEHNFFGYSKENIRFFCQGNLPLLDENGKLVIDENYNIKIASNGNGSIYRAMKENGILEDMKKRKIEWIFIGAVDNILLNMCDPILLGLTIDDKNEIGSKSVVKADPLEKVGVFCKKDNNPAVIEYTELPEEMAEETDEEGELLFGESHIMCNLYSINALEVIADKNLPYHSAYKKINYIDENGHLIVAKKPNGFKYEAFIFDGFNYFNNISILRGRREEDFAPIKNKSGVDSPDTAIELYNNYWKL